ncbi:hypothetical protein PI125_g3486 [Phytophthora idaei]|nr:hypothetical protein PI125_g3486 [Phytophthora idaei]KAG3167794.1 hypothetical protein PI126_g3655 [Phytophthora idaei]
MELYDAHGYVHRHNDGKRGNADTYKSAASRGANCSEDQPLKRFHFEAGKTYLLRLMSMSALAPFEFSIGGQELRIIATATATRSSRRS